ncbi:MAG: hypothetical protein OSA81_07250 [Longimicrobiales bacterium]|nr:hypothetical protein [Longimicrobiales bacterium]
MSWTQSLWADGFVRTYAYILAEIADRALSGPISPSNFPHGLL